MTSKKMPYLKPWRKELTALRGEQAVEIMDAAQQRYQDLYTNRVRYQNPALVRHLEENILPALSLYLELLERGNDHEQAYDTLYQLYKVVMGSPRKQTEFLGRFRWFYWLLKRMIPSTMRRSFPEHAWETEWVEVSDEVIAFNLHSCFYVDTLKAYDAEPLTPLFCSLDDFLYQDVSPYMRWGRTQTIANGAEYCDFRFYRVRPGAEQGKGN